MDSNKYIEHLLTQLEEQHRSLWREKLAVARLQREVAERTSEGAMHEKLMHELEEERHLRLQSEKRLREVTLESERNRIQMRGLQQQFSSAVIRCLEAISLLTVTGVLIAETITKAHDMLSGNTLQVFVIDLNGFKILQTQTF
ncbi:Nck-associated protein 5 [Tupaia chinensis]|uniref:Nck-associated protein 5 n=1 Tax=Tupaia chinensis TaxID=246437 RepID=L9KNM0_TUPCH|nr:Nck-associated protein 5 [Tupaia chinensis]